LPSLLDPLADWGLLDTWTVVTAALAAMACALPGAYLVLRRQSMMGDALSHTALLGIVVGFIAANSLRTEGGEELPHTAMFLGAAVTGVLAALLTEGLRRIGGVEASAALGVVFTTMFALGLLLLRTVDTAHIDAECVLFGTVETVVLEPGVIEGERIPSAAWLNGGMLLVNGLLILAFYKELKVSTFDPQLATALGINATAMHYGLMAVTALTLVAAFESVGSILVIAMLIVPPATAHLLTGRLSALLLLALLAAALSAVLGHVSALVVPPAVFGALGFEGVGSAGTAGMMAAAAGALFVLALVFAPRQGLLGQWLRRHRLSRKIAADDLLGLLYRLEERGLDEQTAAAPRLVSEHLGLGPLTLWLTVRHLRRTGQIVRADDGFRLTDRGRRLASRLVRAHRLWESYLARHFQLAEDHLHESAHRVEHYLGEDLRAGLAKELRAPATDPHGRDIPAE
jgi:manganese/zinc/iron transport system permease protein